MSEHLDELPEDVGAHTGPEAHALSTMHLVREQRTTNRLLLALIAQLGEIARTGTAPGYPIDPAVVVGRFLTAGDISRLNPTTAPIHEGSAD